MQINFSLIPQLRQTAPSWARNLPIVNHSPVTIEEAVSSPAHDILDGFIRTSPQDRIARLHASQSKTGFIERRLYEPLFYLIRSNFAPEDFEQLYKLGQHIKGKDKQEKWEKLIANITEKLSSSEVKGYSSHAKSIIVFNVLNDEWFSHEGIYLYRNQPSTQDAHEEFNSLSVAQLQDELHYIVDGRPITTYFIHSVNPQSAILNSYNYSSIGYVTCNLDSALIETTFLGDSLRPTMPPILSVDLSTPGKGFITFAPEDEQDKVSLVMDKITGILKARYRNPTEFLFANTCDAILTQLCTIGTISQIEKHLSKQQIGLGPDFSEAFFNLQLNNGKLKKVCEHLLDYYPPEDKEYVKSMLGFALFTTAVTLQKGSLSLDPKIALKEILERSSPLALSFLSQIFVIHLLADELHEKIKINDDPLSPDNFKKIDFNKLVEYVTNLADLPDGDLTSAFKNITKREFKNVLDASSIVLVK